MKATIRLRIEDRAPLSSLLEELELSYTDDGYQFEVELVEADDHDSLSEAIFRKENDVSWETIAHFEITE